MTVHVTETDIAEARTEIRAGAPRPMRCPVARALAGAGFARPCVGSFVARWQGGDGPDYANLPESVRDWIYRFDKGVEVEPFDFEFPGGGDR